MQEDLADGVHDAKSTVDEYDPNELGYPHQTNESRPTKTMSLTGQGQARTRHGRSLRIAKPQRMARSLGTRLFSVTRSICFAERSNEVLKTFFWVSEIDVASRVFIKPAYSLNTPLAGKHSLIEPQQAGRLCRNPCVSVLLNLEPVSPLEMRRC